MACHIYGICTCWCRGALVRADVMGSLPFTFHLYFLRRISSLSSHASRLAGPGLQGSFYFWPLTPVVIHANLTSYMDSRGLNSGPHTCMALYQLSDLFSPSWFRNTLEYTQKVSVPAKGWPISIWCFIYSALTLPVVGSPKFCLSLCWSWHCRFAPPHLPPRIGLWVKTLFWPSPLVPGWLCWLESHLSWNQFLNCFA